MPAISLVVCVHKEHDMLQRLLRETSGCYDDLVVVHDGPDTVNIRALVETAGGRFFEQPRARQQEPHWAFAWGQAKNDWILRLDADEFPGKELNDWLRKFRAASGADPGISGYLCVWPLWNGHRTVTKCWPDDRLFLFDRQRVRFFGMAEQTPIPDGRYQQLGMVLNHQPLRKSYGLRNVLFRKQAYAWRHVIAQSLLGIPADLNCWRWDKDMGWPPIWEALRQHPLRTSARRLFMEPFRALRTQWRRERKLLPSAALNNPVNHALIGLAYWRLRRQNAARPSPGSKESNRES